MENTESFGSFLVNIHILIFWLKTVWHKPLFLLFLEHNKFFLVLLVAEMQTMYKYVGILGILVNFDLLYLRFIIKT